jgi:hypothetical protein
MKHPVERIVKIWVKDLDENPRVQLRIHTCGFWFWTAAFMWVTYLFVASPGEWARFGLFITLQFSIYANWTSDYTGMSAAQAVIQTVHKVKVKETEDEVDVEVDE